MLCPVCQKDLSSNSALSQSVADVIHSKTSLLREARLLASDLSTPHDGIVQASLALVAAEKHVDLHRHGIPSN
jgi:hypothetical protein